MLEKVAQYGLANLGNVGPKTVNGQELRELLQIAIVCFQRARLKFFSKRQWNRNPSTPSDTVISYVSCCGRTSRVRRRSTGIRCLYVRVNISCSLRVNSVNYR